MGKLYEFVTGKKLKYTKKGQIKKEYKSILNEISSAKYSFDLDDIGDEKENNSNFLHFALKNSQKYKDIIEAFITSFSEASAEYKEKYLIKAFIHKGKDGLNPLQTIIKDKISNYVRVIRKFLFDKNTFDILSISEEKSKNMLHYLIPYLKAPSLINEYLGILIINHDEGKIKKAISHQDENGNTPLHIAASTGRCLIVRTLLRLGADSSIKNNHEKTAKQLAAENNYLTAASIIQHYSGGSDTSSLPRGKMFIYPLIAKNNNLKDNVKNMVFCGGGVKGIAYLGVVQALESKYPKLLDGIENIAGTSAGAITAFLLALGYGSNEINDFLFGNNTSLTKFMPLNLVTMLKSHSITTGDYFMSWIKAILAKRLAEIYINANTIEDKELKSKFDAFFINLITNSYSTKKRTTIEILKILEEVKILETKNSQLFKLDIKNYDDYPNGFKNINFVDFNKLVLLCREAKGKSVKIPNLRDFYCVATCLTLESNQNIVFSCNATAFNNKARDVSMVDAVRASMAFPGVYKKHIIIIDNKAQKFSDGGILDNYPLSIFDELQTGNAQNNNTLGFLLVNPDKILELEESFVSRTSSPDNIVPTLLQILSSVIMSKKSMKPADLARTVLISNVNVGTVEFNMKPYKRNLLINSGKLATLEFLAEIYSSKIASQPNAAQLEEISFNETSISGNISPSHNIKDLLLAIQKSESLKEAKELAEQIQQIMNLNNGEKQAQKVTSLSKIGASSLFKFSEKDDLSDGSSTLPPAKLAQSSTETTKQSFKHSASFFKELERKSVPSTPLLKPSTPKQGFKNTE